MEMNVKTEALQQTIKQTLEFNYFAKEIDPVVKKKRFYSAIFLVVAQISFIMLMAVFADYDLTNNVVNGTSYTSIYLKKIF